MKEKVFCNDCEEQVEEVNTVLMGHDTICIECIRLDVENFDLSSLLEDSERDINEYLH